MRDRPARYLGVLAALLAGAVAAQPAPDDHAHHAHGGEMLLFTSAVAHRYSPRTSAPRLNEDAPFAADLVLSLGSNRPWRLFGEFLASAEEHDVERLQLGWEARPDTVVWLGRYHQPASAWNLEHHHGRYLQTAVTRPSVELWEDERGIVPQHLAGLLVESRHDLPDGQALRVAAGTGFGANATADGLEPLDLMDPHRDGRQLSWSARLGWQPDALGGSQFGVVAARHRTPVRGGAVGTLDAGLLRQALFGAFADWRSDPWRVAATVYEIRVDAEGGAAPRSERFRVGYLQAEGQLPAGLTAYLRLEDSDGARGSRYVAGIAPEFELRRTLAGLRWDLWRHQAVTVEVGRGTTFAGRRTETRLQWSAVFP